MHKANAKGATYNMCTRYDWPMWNSTIKVQRKLIMKLNNLIRDNITWNPLLFSFYFSLIHSFKLAKKFSRYPLIPFHSGFPASLLLSRPPLSSLYLPTYFNWVILFVNINFIAMTIFFHRTPVPSVISGKYIVYQCEENRNDTNLIRTVEFFLML